MRQHNYPEGSQRTLGSVIPIDCRLLTLYCLSESCVLIQTVMPALRTLHFLLQFESFQDTIRYYLFKYAENKLTFWMYTAGCLLALALIYRMMARKGK